MARNIGLDIEIPERECNDKKCPFHSTLGVRGEVVRAVVVSTAMKGSAVVERTFKKKDSKFERYVKRKSRYHVHLPSCIDVSPGDTVVIAECRKLSKTISHVIVGKVR